MDKSENDHSAFYTNLIHFQIQNNNIFISSNNLQFIDNSMLFIDLPYEDTNISSDLLEVLDDFVDLILPDMPNVKKPDKSQIKEYCISFF
jgi:hypothetical protein